MMLNFKFLSSTLSDSTKSRQERRYEDRHPDRATPPLVKYYTLSIDLDKTQPTPGDGTMRGGWEVAWHMVRGHLRRYKTGKVVPVRPHSKGNPLKAVIHKRDYELKTKGNTA